MEPMRERDLLFLSAADHQICGFRNFLAVGDGQG